MNKVLLIFSYNIEENDIEFQRMIDEFEKNGYDIVNFNGIDKSFDILSLPNYINYVKDQIDYKIDRISVLSNVREFIFIWYRAYNGLVDDFIYFIDDSYSDIFLKKNNLENKFYHKIRDFASLDKEMVSDEIFINLNYKNYDILFNFMLNNFNFSLFKLFSQYDFQNKSSKNYI
ncbi:MAG: hypothetical protein ACOCUI_00415, partial [bacterium]